MSFASTPVAKEAAPSQVCASKFQGGAAPSIKVDAFSTDLPQVCKSQFVSAVSKETNTVVWSAEQLTGENVAAAKGLSTTCKGMKFHVGDHSIPPYTDPSDIYSTNLFVRGHLTPAANMPNCSSRKETYDFSNIVPQNRSVTREYGGKLKARFGEALPFTVIFLS